MTREQISAVLATLAAVTRGRSLAGGEMPCPVCTTGTLRYRVHRRSLWSRSDYVEAQCSTTTCVTVATGQIPEAA